MIWNPYPDSRILVLLPSIKWNGSQCAQCWQDQTEENVARVHGGGGSSGGDIVGVSVDVVGAVAFFLLVVVVVVVLVAVVVVVVVDVDVVDVVMVVVPLQTSPSPRCLNFCHGLYHPN